MVVIRENPCLFPRKDCLFQSWPHLQPVGSPLLNVLVLNP
jgi:hypothetical protein